MPDLVGQTLADRCYLLTKLGEGSMAAVYRAEDRVRGCLVAVKVKKAVNLGQSLALFLLALPPAEDAQQPIQALHGDVVLLPEGFGLRGVEGLKVVG